MARNFKPFLMVFSLALTCGQVARAEAPKPLRHLVYTFSVGITTNTAVSSSGIGTGGSGVTDYGGGVMDKGTIAVDVLQAVDDKRGKALVVSVKEDARESRTAPPVSVILYGDGTVLYDPSLKLQDEERAILKYLGRGFFDSSKLDANNHWQIAQADRQGKIQDDYTVKNSTDGVLNINVVSTIQLSGATPVNSATTGTIVYDANKTVLKSLHLQGTDRRSEGIGTYDTSHSQIDADLTSDSMQ